MIMTAPCARSRKVSNSSSTIASRRDGRVGIPCTISRLTHAVKNANSVWMIGKPFDRDLGNALHREVRCANDANCLAVFGSHGRRGRGQARCVCSGFGDRLRRSALPWMAAC